MYGEILNCMDTVDIEEWEGDDCSLTCPCGHRIEPDAEGCPDGCVNPIREAGMI